MLPLAAGSLACLWLLCHTSNPTPHTQIHAEATENPVNLENKMSGCAYPPECRGFGIVRFPNKVAAETAVNTMNNTTIGGRVVSVRIDRFA